MQTYNTYYWNTADNKDHSHQRIEWAIKNCYLVCCNIRIADKLFSKVKTGDIILAYEPKTHKISRPGNIHGEDGFCMSCQKTSNDGAQAFTNIFTVSSTPIKLTSFEEFETYQETIFRNWYSTIKHCSDLYSNLAYFHTYFTEKKVIYLFPIKHSGLLPIPISTNKSGNHQYIYYGSVIRGFDSFNDPYLENHIKRCIKY
jgi:hypothetical protein